MSQSNLVLAIILACVSAVVISQVVVPGPCPDLTVQQNFDIDSYLGKWYQQKVYNVSFEQGRCDFGEYLDNFNGTYTFIENAIRVSNGEFLQDYALAEIVGENGEAKLTITHYAETGIPADYWVLGTDYVNFAVVWSCRVEGTDSLRLSWILSRERQASNETLQLAYEVVRANNLTEVYKTTDQENCNN
ncbi:apolipoprotein D-like [Neocloeon triangulifer]|uniref:apolipoprotein D-like n=1 Tax=Neocloeon triangulifer TaxID=2078957 RepID=UPI00286F9151|nr:apolipoprotein D-like [Neocloeon triangulifer]